MGLLCLKEPLGIDSRYLRSVHTAPAELSRQQSEFPRGQIEPQPSQLGFSFSLNCHRRGNLHGLRMSLHGPRLSIPINGSRFRKLLFKLFIAILQ
jgi:hypothetical protein